MTANVWLVVFTGVLVLITAFYAYQTYKLAKTSSLANEKTAQMIEETAKANVLTETVIQQNNEANLVNRSLVEESIKQRIDSTAPLLSFNVTLHDITVMTKDARGLNWIRDVHYGDLRPHDDEKRMVQVELYVVISNTGRSPAIIQWANTPLSQDMSHMPAQNRYLENPTNLILLPGETKKGSIKIMKSIKAWLELQDGGSDTQRIGYTLAYSDIRKDHMFAVIEWHGFLNPLKVEKGRILFSTDLPLNAAAPILNIEYRLLQARQKTAD